MPTSLPDSLVSEIDARVETRMENGHWPGLAVGIQYRGQTRVRAYGFADLEHQVPVRAETFFRIGSITKPFTATLIVKLQEMGSSRSRTRSFSIYLTSPATRSRSTICSLTPRVSSTTPGIRISGPVPERTCRTQRCARCSRTCRFASSRALTLSTATLGTTFWA